MESSCRGAPGIQGTLLAAPVPWPFFHQECSLEHKQKCVCLCVHTVCLLSQWGGITLSGALVPEGTCQ